MTTKHIHHIIPKHAGGTDDIENLIELSIADHAKAHKELFDLYGCWEDYLAWQGLAGMITKEELIKNLQSMSAKKTLEKHGNPFSGIRTSTNCAINDEHHSKMITLAKTPEAIEKRKATMKSINHSKGINNSQFGTIWITNGTENKKIKKTDLIPEGYQKGRRIVVNPE